MDEKQKIPDASDFQWVDSQYKSKEIYANLIHLTWTLFDVRINAGQLKPIKAGFPNSGFVVEEQGAMTMSWPQAKYLRDLLVNLITSYEKVNGEIKQPKLAPAEELPPPPK